MLKLGHKMQIVCFMEIITVTDYFTGLIVCLFSFLLGSNNEHKKWNENNKQQWDKYIARTVYFTTVTVLLL